MIRRTIRNHVPDLDGFLWSISVTTGDNRGIGFMFSIFRPPVLKDRKHFMQQLLEMRRQARHWVPNEAAH